MKTRDTNNIRKTISVAFKSITAILILCYLSSCSTEEETAQPSVKVVNLTLLNPTTVVVHGAILRSDIISKEFGYVFSDQPDPTLDNNKVIFDSPAGVDTLSTLSTNTIYYFKIYLVDSENTVYLSEEMVIKTPILHQLTELIPAGGLQGGMEIVIRGRDFSKDAVVYLNETAIPTEHTDDFSLYAIVPYGIHADSVTVSVEIEQNRVSFPERVQYKRGRWTKLSSIREGSNYSFGNMIALSLQGKGYVIDSNKKPIHQYTPETDTWVDIAEYPEEHTGAIWKNWFTTGNQLVIANHKSSKIWVYGFAGNQWIEAPSFPIAGWHARYGVAFSFDNIGYAGLGYDGDNYTTNQLWKFTLNSGWSRLNDFPGKALRGPLAITTSDAVYIIGGSGGEGEFPAETWKYNPASDTWEQKAGYPGAGKFFLTGFAIDNKIYAGCGTISESASYKDFWEYNPENDKWTAVADFNLPRFHMYSFSLGNKGYAGAGIELRSETSFGNTYADLWQFEIE